MKNTKTIITALLLLVTFNIVHAQDTIRLKHINYTTVYSKSLKYPVLVEWWETKAIVQCKNQLARKDQFAPDPLLPKETDLNDDYVGSGTDRGHMCPAATNECLGEKVLTECFYFSNMAPQYHSLNAGDWKSLETYTRELALKYDSIKIWAGSVGVAKKIKSLSVPTKCWKVIYIKQTKTYKVYIFNNDTSKPDGFENNEVKLPDVEKLTGFKFK
jgi:endonuclease G